MPRFENKEVLRLLPDELEHFLLGAEFLERFSMKDNFEAEALLSSTGEEQLRPLPESRRWLC